MREIRFGIIGCGFVADYYMATLANYPHVRIERAYDRNPANAERYSAHWGVPSVADEDAFYDGLDVDAVLNLTNPSSHYEVSRTALERGYAVYSEKPIAMDVDEVLDLRDLAFDKDLPLASAPCNHLSEAFATLRSGIAAGHIGRPLLAYAEMDGNFIARSPFQDWVNPSGAPWPYEDEFAVGCTLEHAGYYLTWLIALFGSVTEVHAYGSLRYPGKPVDDDAAEAPDFTVACLEFANGMSARLTCGVVAPSDHQFRIFGDEGVMHVEDSWFYDTPVKYKRWLQVRRKFMLTPWFTTLKPTPPPFELPKTGSAQMDFIRGPVEMVTAAREGRESRVPLDFSVHFNEVSLAIHTAHERRAVYQVRSRVDDLAPVEVAGGERSSVLEDRIIPVAEKLIGIVRR
ncbi:MAG: Gfo/Idh/MocA family oxidoreductase [Actinomycetota bacterium]